RSPYGGGERRRHPRRLRAGPSARSRVRWPGRLGLHRGHLRRRHARRPWPLRRGPAVPAVVRRGGPALRTSRDGLPGLRPHSGRGGGARARPDLGRGEGILGSLRGGGGMTTGVVLGRRGGTYRVYTEAGEVTASLRGKLKFKDDDRVVAGDIVELEGGGGRRGTNAGIPPRRAGVAQIGRAPVWTSGQG